MALLELKGVTKKFGGLVAVKDMSFVVGKKEILGLIGPNGAGKSTIFNLITGTFVPDAGKVLLSGKDITGFKPQDVCMNGVVRTFQHARVFNEMCALDNVMVAAFSRQSKAKEAMEVAFSHLEKVGLAEKYNVAARSLTICDRMRLQLARALATKPDILLLDESMAGLTPKEVSETLELLRSLREDGMTLVVIEHVMQAVMNLSDRIVVIDHGEKIAEGTPAEVSTNQKVIEAYLGEGYKRA